jgi:CBS domain containing-hemolysin-like protein
MCCLLLMTSIYTDDRRALSSLGLRSPIVVHPETPLMDLLNKFQVGHSHIAIVTKQVDECR